MCLHLGDHGLCSDAQHVCTGPLTMHLPPDPIHDDDSDEDADPQDNGVGIHAGVPLCETSRDLLTVCLGSKHYTVVLLQALRGHTLQL